VEMDDAVGDLRAFARVGDDGSYERLPGPPFDLLAHGVCTPAEDPRGHLCFAHDVRHPLHVEDRGPGRLRERVLVDDRGYASAPIAIHDVGLDADCTIDDAGVCRPEQASRMRVFVTRSCSEEAWVVSGYHSPGSTVLTTINGGLPQLHRVGEQLAETYTIQDGTVCRPMLMPANRMGRLVDDRDLVHATQVVDP
jgi:hypothetical protein